MTTKLGFFKCFLDCVWVCVCVCVFFQGDKGGSSTKLCIQIANLHNANSPETTDLLAFYEATDSDENMQLVFSLFTEMMERVQRTDYVLSLGEEFGNMSCKIFAFGDYEWLCKSLGHIGLNAKYLCLWCKVKLDL